jgi:diacylglycerol kinase
MVRYIRPDRHAWKSKVAWALRGVAWAVRSQSNFAIHLSTAAAVVVAAIVLRASLVEWCVLVVCIAVVLAAEMFNTALEHLARAITAERSEDIRNALDTSAGAVLVAAAGAAIAGAVIFVNRLVQWL